MRNAATSAASLFSRFRQPAFTVLHVRMAFQLDRTLGTVWAYRRSNAHAADLMIFYEARSDCRHDGPAAKFSVLFQMSTR